MGIKAFLAIAIFVISYVFIATERIDKTIMAVLGASCAIFLNLVTFEKAMEAVDLNVVFLLVGMMTGIFILTKTGFFEWAAMSMARFAKGEPLLIVVLLLAVTTVFSAFLDNVTTVMLVAPITILVMQLLELDPVPVVILEAIASNIGGTATLIGDPPNIIIGSRANLSFNAFIVHLTPAIILVFAVFILTIFCIYGRKLKATEEAKERVKNALPHLAILDRRNMMASLVVFAFIFIGFFTQEITGIKPGIVALCGGMVMLLVCRSKVDDMLMKVEWGVIFFFVGIFIMAAALEANGVIAWIGQRIVGFAGDNLLLVCVVILWGSAVFSSVLGSIPFVVAMVPLIEYLVSHTAAAQGIGDPIVIKTTIAYPLWWSLALGSCLGGNGTLIGAAANMVSAKICEKNRYSVSFGKFFKYGFPFMVQSLLVSTLYVWVRYFLLVKK